MYRPLLLLLLAIALIAACLPLETKQAAISSADEALEAVAEMARDKGWIVTAIGDTSVIAREAKKADEDELRYTVTVNDRGTILTLNVHRLSGGWGHIYITEPRYYDEFFEALADYQ